MFEQIIAKAAAAPDRYKFKDPSFEPAIIVRADLNGYSNWAATKTIAQRVQLLDDFFSRVVPLLENRRGVFFRDEGDCIIGLFAAYFSPEVTYADAEAFAMTTVNGEYGAARLTAKCAVSVGDVAIFQKAHEAGTEDWSAEGQPFVKAARLEQAIASKKQVVYYKTDYDAYFSKTNVNTSGQGSWNVKNEKLQVPGLSLAGGWTDVTVLEPKV